MSSLVLTTAQKQAIRQASSPEAACHLVYHATDDAFYFGNADDITGWIRDAQLEDDFDTVVYDEIEKEFLPSITKTAPASERSCIVIAFCQTDFRKASVETLGGGLRTSRPTSRWALACPVLVGLAVLSQPPSKPMIIDQETAC